jgi:hypothetical protein
MKRNLLWIIPLILGGIFLYQNTYKTENEKKLPKVGFENSASLAEVSKAKVAAPIQAVVDPEPVIPVARRVGVNLRQWTTWGAEQFMRNIVMNPGFEGQFDRIVLIVSQTDNQSFSDEHDLGMPDGYWDGAAFEVRSGQSVGQKGTIRQSLNQGVNGLPQYFTEGEVPVVLPRDVIILTKQLPSDPLPQWWIPDSSKGMVVVDPEDPRPGSTGKQSVVLMPNATTAAELNFYFDGLGSRAGKLLLVEGKWRLSFWVKMEGDADGSLLVKFSRLNGTGAFFSKNITPTSTWQEVTYDFSGNDNGSPEILQLAFRAAGENVKIKLDDVFLGPVQTSTNLAFRDEVVDLLTQMKPSYIRDWQGQLSDTFQNRIADPYARQTYYFRGHGGTGSQNFSYSLPEFLDLAEYIHAKPWIIIPTTITDAEADDFGTWLSQNAASTRFAEVVLEFGNENWNWIFRSGGIPYPESQGPVADRVFQRITATAGPNVKLKKVVNGQHAVPSAANAMLDMTPSADILAVAPYFFYPMQKDGDQAENVKNLFATDGGLLQQEVDHAASLKKNLAVYEINLTTAQGTAPGIEREPFVAGGISGTALAKQILLQMFNKASPILVYAFSQYDTATWDIQDFVKLWGVTLDLSPTKRFRPTGLAIVMLNKVLNGSMHRITVKDNAGTDNDQLTMAAFRSKNKWSAALASSNSKPMVVVLQFPDDGRQLPTAMDTLSASSPFDTNEQSEKVKIVEQAVQSNERNIAITIPAYGFVVLTYPIEPLALELGIQPAVSGTEAASAEH